MGRGKPGEARLGAIENNVIQRNGYRPFLAVVVVADKSHLAAAESRAAQVVEAFHCDTAEVRVRGSAGAAVGGVEHQREFDVAHAHVLVADAVNESAVFGSRLYSETNAVLAVCAVHCQIHNTDVVYAAVGFTADGHAVSVIKMIVREHQVAAARGPAGLYRYVVIAGTDVGVGQQYLV